MRQIEIDLSEPFERVLSCVLALPSGTHDILGNGSGDDKKIEEAIRELYEAANGRHVETRFGWIAIAPPVADFLKARPYYIETQIDLLIEAATRIICGPPPLDVGIVAFETAGTSWHPGDGYLPVRAASTNGTTGSPLRTPEKERSLTTRLISLNFA